MICNLRFVFLHKYHSVCNAVYYNGSFLIQKTVCGFYFYNITIISAYPMRARRVVVMPVSPIFTFSSALRSTFEVMFFFKAILSRVLERMNHTNEPTQVMMDMASVMNPAVAPKLAKA